ncbi:MAG: hypothetical protein K2J47_02485 [Ruminococcus sp.]|nr:hypothetical protein [Ruminococcus sp.]
MIFLIIFFAVTETAVYLIRRKRKSHTLKFAAKLLFAAVLLEITVFQYPSYRLVFGDYPHKILYTSDAEYGNCQYSESAGGIELNGTDEISLVYRNIDAKVGTVHVNVKYPDDDKTQCFNFFADMTDETGYYYRMKIIESQFVSGSKTSCDSMVNLSGKTGIARFRFSGLSDENSCVIESIELNKKIPFDIIYLRVLIIEVIGTFIYACMKSETMHISVKNSRKVCNTALAAITSIAVCCVVLMVISKIPQGEFLNRFRLTEGDQITQELVLAFENGQVNLLDVPDERLLEMENPYDTASRYYKNIPALWDHLLYNGKYYSYYGIAPLIVFLPYHLITGYFFPTDIAVMIFSCIGIVFLALFYDRLVKRWFGKIPTVMYISGLIIILASCGIWFLAGRPKFYECAISSGFACITAGAYLLIKSEKVNLLYVSGSSVLFGLAVMCRPTLVLYALCTCVYYITFLKKAERKVPYLISAFLPLVIIGTVQMCYNYARFDSVFDFGIQYSLTVNDFIHTEYHVHQMLIGVYNFIFASPVFIPDYPFVKTPFSQLGINGYYFNDTGNTSGILFSSPTVFAYIFSVKALKSLSDFKSGVKNSVLVGLPCVIMPMIIICVSWESGYSVRYIADFSWQIICGSFIVLFFLYTRTKKYSLKRIFCTAMGLTAVCTLFVNGIQVYNFTFPQDYYPHFADFLRRFVEILY